MTPSTGCSTTREIDAISFVGQASTARYIAERSAANGKRFQALGGAKNSLIVMPDADLDVTVPAIMSLGVRRRRPALPGRLGRGAGRRPAQSRTGRSTRSTAAAADLGVGPGDQEGSRSARWSGPRPATGSPPRSRPRGRPARTWCPRRPSRCRAGRDPDRAIDRGHRGPESDLVREELFGPLLAVVRADDLDGALEFANGRVTATPGRSSRPPARPHAPTAGVPRPGCSGVNVGVAAPVAWFPFSGWKDSIDGDLHANGTDAVEFYTRKKVVTSRWV